MQPLGGEDEAWSVVGKLGSDSIAHKSDVGGVRLDLRTDDEVRRAVMDICEALAHREVA